MIKFSLYNFLVSYKLNKINFINTFLKRLDYKNKNKNINKLLFTL